MTHPDLPYRPDHPRPDDLDADATHADATHADDLHADDPAADDRPPDAGAPLDPALLAAARAYHRPPPAPADAMWAAIQARRAARSAAGATAPADAPPVGAFVRQSVRQSVGPGGPAGRRWASLAAAVLLVAAGVAVGRTTAPGGDAPGAAARPDLPAPLPPAPPVALAPSAPAVRAPQTDPPAPSSAATGRRGAPGAAAEPLPQLALDAARPLLPARDVASAPLRAATEQHLAQAEALLTTFAAGPAGGAAAAPDSVWARDLLTTTRLLLDSPAGADPARRGLLDALELVLVQIARLPRADSPAERALIDRAIRRGDLMARLRSAVPAGAPAVPAPVGS